MEIQSSSIVSVLRFLFKPIIDVVGIILFYNAYRMSSLYHDCRENTSQPRELTEDLECKIFWKTYHRRRKLVTPMIWVRSSRGTHFSKVVLTVTAFNDKIKYQDCVTLFDVSSVPCQAALPSIPFRHPEFEGRLVFTPYDYIQTEVKELYGVDGNTVDVNYAEKVYVKPFDRLEIAMGLQKGYVEAWGETFNLEFIEMALVEEKIRLRGPMLRSSNFVYDLRRKIFNINWIVKCIFWSKNIIFAKQISSEVIKYIEEKTAQKNGTKNHGSDFSI